MMTTTTAQFDGLRRDLPEGREWLVTTPEAHSYVVTVFVDAEHGRMATCRCRAFTFGRPCRHIRFVQMADSFLTRAPVREIQAVAA